MLPPPRYDAISKRFEQAIPEGMNEAKQIAASVSALATAFPNIPALQVAGRRTDHKPSSRTQSYRPRQVSVNQIRPFADRANAREAIIG